MNQNDETTSKPKVAQATGNEAATTLVTTAPSQGEGDNSPQQRPIDDDEPSSSDADRDSVTQPESASVLFRSALGVDSDPIADDGDDDDEIPVPSSTVDSNSAPASDLHDHQSSPSSIDSQASSFGMLLNSKASSFEMLANSPVPLVDAAEASDAAFSMEDGADRGDGAHRVGDLVDEVVNANLVAGLQEASQDEEEEQEVDQEDEVALTDLESFEREIQRLHSLDDLELPKTVARLKTQFGTRIFLVGTAHFSSESQEDVSTTIRAVEPDVVMVELCDNRERILSLDEETILRESKSLNSTKIMEIIKDAGFLQGISYVLLLNLSAHITKKLGMAPGGEFRRAFCETKLLQEKKNAKLHLGDRPVGVTLKRALGMLTIWQKLHLCWSLLTEKLDISKEDIEKMKEKDMLETLLQEMAKDYPTLSQVFVHERDIWLAHALSVSEKMAMHHAPQLTANGVTHILPSVVVAVVGMGHQPGIINEWEKIEESQLSNEEKKAILMELVRIPPPSLASKILGLGYRAAKLTLILWTCHKIYKWIYSP